MDDKSVSRQSGLERRHGRLRVPDLGASTNSALQLDRTTQSKSFARRCSGGDLESWDPQSSLSSFVLSHN